MTLLFNNILKELSSEFEGEYAHFANKMQPMQQLDTITQLRNIVGQWVGHAYNKKGMRIEKFMKKNRPDLYQYMQSSLRKEFGNTVSLMRGIAYNALMLNNPALKEMNRNIYNMYRHKKGLVDLMARNVKYSSWTRDEELAEQYASKQYPSSILRSDAIGFILTADIPVDHIIFCGEVFPSDLYDDHTDREFVVRHDRMMHCRYEMIHIGRSAQEMLDMGKEEIEMAM